MCGIAGYLTITQKYKTNIDKTLSLMQRRGPDATGIYQTKTSTGKNLLLLHSRLSIIDIHSRANQPFHKDHSTMILNGELYNYLELKSKLGNETIDFKTTSDTEVLITALNKYGTNILDSCEGMWAFAYFNARTETLLLSRDRFGEKPLYIYRNQDGIFFASEIKFLSALANEKFSINQTHIYRYLVNGYKSLYKSHETFYNKVTELPASHSLTINNNGIETVNKYWQPQYKQDDTITREDAIHETKHLLINSLELRLRSDVPLAFCMSGGVDSNSLISIAKNHFKYDVHGFTIVNKDKRYEEQELINLTVKELQIKHTPIMVNTNNFIPQLKKLISYHDAPIYTISYYAHWLLMKAIAEHGYKISISGTAADELFTGYYDHQLLYLAEIYGTQASYDNARKMWETHTKPIVRNPFLQNPDVFIKDPQFREHIYLKRDFFNSFLHKNFNEYFYEAKYTKSSLRNRMLNELFHEVIPVILHEDDLNAMYFSIENRSPFLDKNLFNFCIKIPTQHLIHNGYTKSILRDAMQGIVPDSILKTRKKVGFNAPLFSFLDRTDPDTYSFILDDSPVFDIVNKIKINQLLDKEVLLNSESKFLFNFICSKIFLENNN